MLKRRESDDEAEGGGEHEEGFKLGRGGPEVGMPL